MPDCAAPFSMLTPPNYSSFDNKVMLITGGTGSLGKAVVRLFLTHSRVGKIIVLSRDEFKQSEMAQTLTPAERVRLRFFLGDVRDASRLSRAFHGVDYVIHAAALKQVPAAEYNPFEFVRTNVIGAENVINAAIDCGVKRVVALSTDKAAQPINLYGATKLCSDKLFIAGNSYSGESGCQFAVVRYGNVLGSRGSVVPFFLKMRESGHLPITDFRMTRFWITLTQAACFVVNALCTMRGGEIFVPKIPSMKILDLARAVAPDCECREIGIRPGEKLHETMISVDDARQAVEYSDHYVICPILPFWDDELRPERQAGGKPCPPGFVYTSDANPQWLTVESLRALLATEN